MHCGVAKVVKYWSADNINDKIRFVPDLDIYWSLDFNVNPFMSTLAHFDGKKFFVFDELVAFVLISLITLCV